MGKIFRTRVCAFLLACACAAFAGNPVAEAAPPATGNTAIMKRALLLYSQGKYSDTIQALNQIKHPTRDAKAAVHYWKGHCLFKLKEFTAAIHEFRAAEREGMKAADLNFTLGQSLYAAQRLEEAKSEFEKSAAKGFKKGPSLYYVGYIYQTLEKKRTAAETYAKVIRLPDDPDKVKQPAKFQIAEMKYAAFQEQDPKNQRFAHLEDHILRLYTEARDMDEESATYAESKARIEEIRAYLAKHKPKFPLVSRATFEFAYDSNVITKADGSLITSISRQDSFVFKPTLRLNYLTNLGNKWSIDFGLRSVAKLHSARSTPDIYKNDNFTFEPAATVEKTNVVFGKPGTYYFTYEYNYQLQDYLKRHEFPYYSRSHNFETGQRANMFATGQTTLKGNFKFYENYNPAQNSLQPGLDLNQKFKIGENSLSTTLAVDWLTARAKINDTVTYKWNNRYPIDWGKNWNFTPKFNLWFVDTKYARVTRGIEKKWNPGLSFRKQMEDGGIWRLSYDFTRNISLDKQNQQYRRHEVALSYEKKF